MTKVSILIPTYNAESYIETLLRKILKQKLLEDQSIEIIIVDSSSQDNTVKIVKKEFPGLKILVINNDEFDHGGTRNLLSSLSSGEYLLFMTQDAIPYDDYLIHNLLNTFENREVLVSYARQIPHLDATPLERFARSFNYPESSIAKDLSMIKNMGIKTFFNSNVCSMYKREAFLTYKGFPEQIILNEDMVFSSRVILDGFKVYYCAEAKVYHSHNYSLLQQFKRYFDIGMAFNDTKYLFNYVSNEKEGARMIGKQLKYLFNEKKYHFLLIAFLDNVAKFIGYYLGKKHNKIPRGIKKKLSAYMK